MTRLVPSEPAPRRSVMIPALWLAAAGLLTACGGGSSGSVSGNNGGGGGSSWTPGMFLDADTFFAQCVSPRSGTNPATGQPYPDVAGTRTDENNFLRSYSNDTYLWYDEITDRDPSQHATLDYFDLLKTEEMTASGADKDRFHFTYPSDEYYQLAQSGTAVGYGALWVLMQTQTSRTVLVAFTDPGSPATAAGFVRGTEILEVDGVDLDVGTQAGVDILNAGLFPQTEGETHDFRVRDLDGTERDVTLLSEEITSPPVPLVSVETTPTGNVGYILFNDHNAPSEQALIDAVEQLDAANVVDLVLDIRYNGGGFLSIASQLAYMIAGNAQTAGQTFEVLVFNDKHPATNPVTGQPISPVPFLNTTSGNQPEPLPTLDLSRVFVLTGAGTCSASESVMNGLRGVGVEVIQIGSTTCGKPYGFYPTDNCGTTYFTIQFRGENAQGFGDYGDGFSPQNSTGPVTTSLPGCSVADDFENALGEPVEARFAAALAYDTQGCPTPSGVRLPGFGKTEPGRYPDAAIEVPRSPLREMRIMDL